MVHKIRKYLRELYSYARRHPMKIFILVIMPLITGGALADLLRRFGIRLPGGMQKMLSSLGGRGGGLGGALGGLGGGRGGGGFGGSGEGVEGLMKIAKMFI